MKKSLVLAIAAAGVAMFTAQAAMAHGDHRSCQEGRAGWHYHAGKYGQHRVACSPPRRSWNNHNRDHRCVTKCTGFGPFKKCTTRCN